MRVLKVQCQEFRLQNHKTASVSCLRSENQGVFKERWVVVPFLYAELLDSLEGKEHYILVRLLMLKGHHA